jgi:hypothetical protein
MTIESIYPRFDIVREMSAEFPEAWRVILAAPESEAMNELRALLGIVQTSEVWTRIAAATEIGVLIPKRKRERGDHRLWQLAVAYAGYHAMSFAYPSSEFLTTSQQLPADYVRVVSMLGALQFDSHLGRTIWPCRIEECGMQLSTSESIVGRYHLIPFFDHGTGDFDCWTDTRFDTVVTFDHERSNVQPCCNGNFPVWLTHRFSRVLWPIGWVD